MLVEAVTVSPDDLARRVDAHRRGALAGRQGGVERGVHAAAIEEAVAGEFALNIETRALPVIHADNYLNDLLLQYCEAVLAKRRGDVSQLRTKVENAISSLLPHGRVVVGEVARNLGMSERTLGRKLADEGLNFTDILQQLRRDLAVRYLDDRKLRVSKIAWLLVLRR